MGHVYLIVNHATAKVYVGKTVKANLRSYLNRKISDAFNKDHDKTRRACPHLYNAIRKHGPMPFKIYALTDKIEDSQSLCSFEQFFIKAFNSRNPEIGYNVTSGGDGAQPGEGNMFFGRKHSEQTRRRLRECRIGRPMTDETKAKIRATIKAKGIKPPSSLGSKQSEATINKRVLARAGWKHTEETKQRMRITHPRNWLGKKHSAETIAKMRRAQLDRRTREAALACGEEHKVSDH